MPCSLTSNFFSSTVTKGISANMLKMSSKRRRTIKQIQKEKLAKEQETAETQAKLA